MTSTIARLLVLLAALLNAGVARADGERPGEFDFYVLSLSWSPTFCESPEGRGSEQCAARRPFAFVVHGLWPQYERGYPAFCPADAAPDLEGVRSVLDIMPSAGLVRHQWRKHGTCSGLGTRGYFDAVREAFARVEIPPSLQRLDKAVSVEPRAVERAFRAVNPGIQDAGIAVTCDGRRLAEVRICMTKEFDFRPCPEVDRRGCTARSIVLPPVR